MPSEGNLSHPNWHIRIISTPGPDTDLSVLVFFDNARFLIGAGEGTQRAFIQKKLGMKGLAGVFLPNSEQRTRGGLPAMTGERRAEGVGILMTAADAGMNKVDLIGPPDTTHYLATLRSCVIRDRFSVNAVAFPPNRSSSFVREVYKSSFITVSAIALTSSSSPPPTNSDDDPTPLTSTNGALEFDPCEINFRASTLSPRHIQQWRSTIVQEMFGRALRPPLPPPPTLAAISEPLNKETAPYRSPPFCHPATGKFTPTLPSSEYPLPLPTAAESTDMVYIFQAPDVRGKFDVKRANELKVPSGPIRGRLTKGESVEVDDPSAPGGKRVVRPEDCLVGGGPGAAFIVVSCTPETLSSLLDSTAFEPYFPSAFDDEGASKLKAHAVIHRVAPAVYNDERYRAWMARFGPDTQHLIVDPEHYLNDTFFTSAAWNVLHLSLLDWDMFPYPWSTTPTQGFEQKPPLAPNVQFARPNQTMKMHPPSPLEVVPRHSKDREFPTTIEDASEARKGLLSEMKEYFAACKSARTSVQKDPMWWTKPTFAGHDIVVTTLGTGSAMPSKYRNVSSTLLQIPGTGGVLLDCGEGTLGQLRRRFGPEGLREVYEELKMIFISHLHADHHLGLQSILEDRFKHGITSKLYLIAPSQIALALQESPGWQKLASEEALANLQFIDCFSTSRHPTHATEDALTHEYIAPSPPPAGKEARRLSGIPREWVEEDVFSGARKWPAQDIHAVHSSEVYSARAKVVQDMLRDLKLHKFQAPAVDHRGRAYGLVLVSRLPDTWTIVYSGDTKPCDRLVEAGKDATLLIHEATLEDDKPETAAQKGHSTFGQAIEIGKRMNAKHILLNHFSQRYPKVPILSDANNGDTKDGIAGNPVVSISFDLMTARISDLWKMRYYLNAVNVLFAEDEVEDGDETTAAVEHDINAGAEDADLALEENAVNGGHAPRRHKAAKAAVRHKPHSPRVVRAVGKKRSSTPPPGTHGKKPKEAVAESNGDVEMPGSPKLTVPKTENVMLKKSESRD